MKKIIFLSLLLATIGMTSCTTDSSNYYETTTTGRSNYYETTTTEATQTYNQKSTSHTCEECGDDADYSIIGISGQKEYYCKKHYDEMSKMLGSMMLQLK